MARKSRLRRFAPVMALSGLSFTLLIPAVGASGTMEVVSISNEKSRGDGLSVDPTLSADGSLVAFTSRATNLVPGDTNGTSDVFVRDRETNETERVSVASDGSQSDGPSASNPLGDADISGDGRWVVFASRATNLVTVDINDAEDVFLHDRVTGATELVSLTSVGTQTFSNFGSTDPSVSDDGRYVAFASEATDLLVDDVNGSQPDVFVRDRGTGSTALVSVSSSGEQANAWSEEPMMSADGRYVAFLSNASNLVAGDTNGVSDIFVRDLTLGTTERVNVTTHNRQFDKRSFGPAMSPNGRFVGFYSIIRRPGYSFNTIHGFLRDRQHGITEEVTLSSDGEQSTGGGTWLSSDSSLSISHDGRFVTFYSGDDDLVPGDTNGRGDVFVRDRIAGTTTLVSQTGEGVHDSGSPAISADGEVIAFHTTTSWRGPGPDQIFVHAAAKPTIDVKPGDSENMIVTHARSPVEVAILGAPRFEASLVDVATACFGDAEEPDERDCSIREAPKPRLEDVNGDGHPDLVLRFDVEESGVDRGDTRACLNAETPSGPFEACDAVLAV